MHSATGFSQTHAMHSFRKGSRRKEPEQQENRRVASQVDWFEVIRPRLNVSTSYEGSWPSWVSTCVEDKILSHSDKLIPASLLKLPKEEATCAVAVFRKILDCMELSNHPLDREKRQELIAKIAEKCSASKQLQDELFLQLLKQTRRCTDPDKLKSAWSLFKQISEIHVLRCSFWLSIALCAYVETVACRKAEDPLVRVLAYGVLDACEHLKMEGKVNDYKSIIRNHLSGEVLAVYVVLPGGRSRRTYYDSDSLVSDAAKQVAWIEGYQNPEEFAIFGDHGEGYVLLDQNSRLSDVLGDERRSRDNLQPRLRLRRVLDRVTDEEKADPLIGNASFVHWRESYLEASCDIQEKLVVQLCALQIQGCHDRSVFNDHGKLFDLVSKCIPEKSFKNKSNAEWVKDVIAYSKIMDPLSNRKAQAQFLQVCRGLQCSKCCESRVTTVGQFLIEQIEPGTELNLIINCNGILLYLQGSNVCLLTIDFTRILGCKAVGDVITIDVQKGKRQLSFQLATFYGKRIYEAIKAHKDIPINEEANQLQSENQSLPSDAAMPTVIKSSFLTSLGQDRRDREREDMWKELMSIVESRALVPKQGERTPNVKPPPPASCKNNQFMATQDALQFLLESYPACRTLLQDLQKPSTVIESKGYSSDQMDSVDTKTDRSSSNESVRSFNSALNNLSKDYVFRRKYRIQSRMTGKAHMFYAEDIRSNQDVILKFYLSYELFENSRDMHRGLMASNHVCRMLDVVEKRSYPPCLVFERGEHTLDEWIQQEKPRDPQRKNALHQILLGLIDLHSCKIVHRDLKPQNIMFFPSDNAWKLLDLDSAAIAGEPSIVHKTLVYASPEVVGENQRAVIFQTSADMWAFGIIVFETMSGKESYRSGDLADPDRIKALFSSGNELIDSKDLEAIKEGQVRYLIKQLVCTDPRKRSTAEQAANHAAFLIAPSTSHKMVETEQIIEHLPLLPEVIQLPLDRLPEANLMAAIAVESLPNDAKEHWLEEGTNVPVTTDESLPDDPVFVLTAGDCHRLRITLIQKRNVQMPIKRVVRLTVSPPDAGAVELPIKQIPGDDSLECKAIALLDPTRTGSWKLNDIESAFGEPDEELVKLDVTIVLGISANSEHEFELKQTIYCKMVKNEQQPNLPTSVRRYDRNWDKVPQWKSIAAEASVSCANLVVIIKQ